VSPVSWRLCVLRGDLYRFTLSRRVGHEQHGERYGVVVQADELLPRSVVLVAPTSRRARAASFRPEIQVAGAMTRVLVEQVGAVDVQRLGGLAGHVSREELWGIDDALLTVFGLR
jgi:mRNA interferase MazF